MPFTKKVLKVIGFFILFVVVVAVLILIFTPPLCCANRDARRVADIKKISSELELYYSAKNTFPIMLAVTPEDWKKFSEEILNSSSGIQIVPHDPDSTRSFMYASKGGTKYILGALFDNKENKALDKDIDGVIDGIDCNDPVYCIDSTIKN